MATSAAAAAPRRRLARRMPPGGPQRSSRRWPGGPTANKNRRHDHTIECNGGGGRGRPGLVWIDCSWLLARCWLRVPLFGHSTAHSTRANQRTMPGTQHTAHSTQHTAHRTPHTAHHTHHTAHITPHTAHFGWPFSHCQQTGHSAQSQHTVTAKSPHSHSTPTHLPADRTLLRVLLRPDRECRVRHDPVGFALVVLHRKRQEPPEPLLAADPL